MTLEQLASEWREAKQVEKEAIEKRRFLEDQMKKALKISDMDEGTISHKGPNFQIKAVCRMNRKVDGNMLLALAQQYGYSDQLPNLVRWKADIIQAGWKAASDDVTNALSAAVTFEPGRPTFNVNFDGE